MIPRAQLTQSSAPKKRPGQDRGSDSASVRVCLPATLSGGTAPALSRSCAHTHPCSRPPVFTVSIPHPVTLTCDVFVSNVQPAHVPEPHGQLCVLLSLEFKILLQQVKSSQILFSLVTLRPGSGLKDTSPSLEALLLAPVLSPPPPGPPPSPSPPAHRTLLEPTSQHPDEVPLPGLEDRLQGGSWLPRGTQDASSHRTRPASGLSAVDSSPSTVCRSRNDPHSLAGPGLTLPRGRSGLCPQPLRGVLRPLESLPGARVFVPGGLGLGQSDRESPDGALGHTALTLLPGAWGLRVAISHGP